MKKYIIVSLFKGLERKLQKEIIYTLESWYKTGGKVVIPRWPRGKYSKKKKDTTVETNIEKIAPKRKYTKRKTKTDPQIAIGRSFENSGNDWMDEAKLFQKRVQKNNEFTKYLYQIKVGQTHVFFKNIFDVSPRLTQFKNLTGRVFQARTIGKNMVETTRIS